MRHQLSILIPCYNSDPSLLVADLSRQAEAVAGLDYEVIVADDGSPDRSLVERCRAAMAGRPHCRHIARDENSGRAAIRNFLAREARYDWLLFIDSDMSMARADFLCRYLDSEGMVVYGGYVVGEGERGNLRYTYEKACAPQHRAVERAKHPYQHFHTANFLVSRQLMLAHPFNERFRTYGYEDVLFGKELQQAGQVVTHIDNPVGFFLFEDNAAFVSKTEEGLRTLCQFSHELRGYSNMLSVAGRMHPCLRGLIRGWHRLFGRHERRWLCGSRPDLRVFKLYKLGYFLSITNL